MLGTISVNNSGAPNDGLLLQTLITSLEAFQTTFRPLEMHSKRRHKICICSITLEHTQPESAQNYQGSSISFRKIVADAK